MQPSLSSWPHSDITPLGHSVTCTFLASPFFYSGDVFGKGIVKHEVNGLNDL